MAFQKGYVEVSLEVLAAPGCFLTADPMARQVAKGDPAIFNLTIQRLEGFVGPVYLQVVNLVGGHAITPNPIPAGETAAVLEVDTSGWQVDLPPTLIGIEANDVPYPQEG
ncbi:MAG TPA: hypothetical protein VFI02_03630 [Armatimonadota bacterium]|nr:hypothetical protein [Armatimonadota bacterium]